MLNENSQNNFKITSESVVDWLIKEEPELVKNIYNYFLSSEVEISFDTSENVERLKKVSQYIEENAKQLYQSLQRTEKFLLYIMKNCFGWIVYEDIEFTMKILAKIFHYEYDELMLSVQNLFDKYLLFKYERLKRYNFLFTPPVFLRNIEQIMDKKEIFNALPENNHKIREISPFSYISLIAGIVSYMVTYSPRSSETNEIHKIDLNKMVDFFADFSDRESLEKIIKKLSRFGFFQKVNNRIIINKSLFDTIVGLSINEQLFFVFLYDFMDRFDFRQSAFMTLKILAKRKEFISLRELFFYYLNNETYVALKNDMKNRKLLLQQEELKFTYFIKSLEAENCAVIKKKDADKCSIATDEIALNEPHSSLLNNIDFCDQFNEDKFVVEPNFEIIVEPYLKPEILFRLALISEPQTIQTISIFKITKESIYRSFAYGIEKDEILSFLEKNSKHALPDIVRSGILSFINDLKMENMDHYQIIQISAHHSTTIKDNFKNKLIEVEPHTFLVFDSDTQKAIEVFCKEHRITMKLVKDFLKDTYFSSFLSAKNSLSHNIKHLHKMKDFFDYYGNIPIGSNIKIDNKI